MRVNLGAMYINYGDVKPSHPPLIRNRLGRHLMLVKQTQLLSFCCHTMFRARVSLKSHV